MKTLVFLLSMLTAAPLFAEKLQPNENEALLKIFVTDFQDRPRTNDIVILRSEKTKKEYQCITDTKGYAEVLLPKGDTYQISYKELVRDKDYSSVTIPQISGLMTSTLTIKYEPAKTITLDNVYFDFNKATLKTDSYQSLDELADFMKIKKTMVIEIAGHTDDVGDSAYNKTLSQSRAESVRNYLIKKGISAERLVAKGYGEDQPIAGNNDEESRAKNRRTEIRIISE
jgi:OmpA-OmpF porin, OOP family